MSQGVNINSLSAVSKPVGPSARAEPYAKQKQEDRSSFEKELSSQSQGSNSKRSDYSDKKENSSQAKSGNSNANHDREDKITSYRKNDSQSQGVEETNKQSHSQVENEEPSVEKTKGKDGEALEVANNKEPILKFLDSMERELGVESDRILAAFAQMPNDVLHQPAQATQNNFVQNLDLPSNQETKAQQLYSTMLQDMHGVKVDNGLPPALHKMSLADSVTKEGQHHLMGDGWQMQEGEEFITKQEMNPIDIKKQRIAERNAKLEALNDRFFNVYPKAEAVDVNQPLANQVAAQTPQLQIRHQNRLSPEGLDIANQKGIQSDIPNWLQSVSMNDGGFNAGAQGEQGAMDSEAFLSKENQKFLDLKSMVKENAKIEDSESLEQILKSGDGTKAIVNDKVLKANPVNANEAVNNNEKIRVEDIVQKADLLVKKGGGEMKIQMSPDGLGEVHLNVRLNEGKVDVKITAENNQAKRIIESELINLKAIMAEGKVDLREIKVDVAQNMQNQLEEQLADQQRENARDFLDFFRKNHGSHKNALQYASGSKVYQESQNPEDIARDNKNYQRSRSTEDGRLSVVA